MIKRRLVMYPRGFHWSQWEVSEFQKYFRKVSQTSRVHKIKFSDVLIVYGTQLIKAMANINCVKFGMWYPGFRCFPYRCPDHLQEMLPIIDKYSAIFVNEGPIWEALKGHPKIFLVPYSAAHTIFKKIRRRDRFKRIIQVARNDFYKGRHISEAAMKIMPYSWDIIPHNKHANVIIDYSRLPDIYQSADGFLSPNLIGPPPKYETDAKYTQSTMEAGLSGCIIFWHDCMKTGNSFETVFPISLDPKEIAQKVKDVVNSIDLDRHSTLTAQEFYEKCNAEQAVKAKVEIIKNYL